LNPQFLFLLKNQHGLFIYNLFLRARRAKQNQQIKRLQLQLLKKKYMSAADCAEAAVGTSGVAPASFTAIAVSALDDQ
jgi:hypothetical protein